MMFTIHLCCFILGATLLHVDETAALDVSVDFTMCSTYGCSGNCNSYEFSSCINFPNWYNSIKSLRINKGSCMILRKGFCADKAAYEERMSYPTSSFCNLNDYGWNEKVYSLRVCSTRTSRIQCPTGTFIRQIEYLSPTDGMTIKCYKPTEGTPSLTRNTHGKTISNPTRTACPIAAHGIGIKFDEQYRLFKEPELLCKRNSSEILNSNEVCENKHALTGVSAVIDEADVIKEVTYTCTKVEDPALLCEPMESIGLVMQCDNTASGNEMQCKYSQTIGVGKSSTMTATAKMEMEFSLSVGYEIGMSIGALSASMSLQLGYSALVGYEWSQSDTRTWSEETTVEVTINVRPYTHSKIEQLIGKCSFFGTRVNFFKQTDINSTQVPTVSYLSV